MSESRLGAASDTSVRTAGQKGRVQVLRRQITSLKFKHDLKTNRYGRNQASAMPVDLHESAFVSAHKANVV